ncbi:hypothetical protein BTA51_09360 [Hahella sp. CCB-MM4]|uniref:baseplate J/gp47 family protein n=1 Tax=Hahella sp. (strain CCB-MM4) TaxID=1926491 RepID=UPI000B9BE621|nr:baseplate J/gp47 family protein [Hahella sp. CCB-MM4]OZG73977.1 hypothetical protein BTA51_09360 [Hahella sp. CCB-MM4]
MNQDPDQWPLSPGKVDPRSTADIYQQALALAKIYCPQWSNINQLEVDEEDIGVVLLKLFAQLSNTLSRRFNLIPHKQLLSFYQFLGLQEQLPKPAQVLLSYELSTDVTQPVVIPTGSQVASAKDQKVIYETITPLNATNIPLMAAYTISPVDDGYIDLSGVVLSRNQLFSIFGSSTQYKEEMPESSIVPFTHTLHLSSKYFDYHTPAALVLNITFAAPFDEQIASDIDTLFRWFIYDDKGERQFLNPAPLTTVSGSLLSLSFTKLLIPAAIVEGQLCNWLGCQLNQDKIPLLDQLSSQQSKQQSRQQRHASLVGPEQPLLAQITDIKFDLSASNLAWDKLFVNDGEVSAQKGFYIFGNNPAVMDTFYFGNNEAFIEGFEVTLSMNVNPGKGSDDLKLAWQYWDGEEWLDLQSNTTVEKYDNGAWQPIPNQQMISFESDTTSVSDSTSATEITIRFICPAIEQTKINEVASRWIRIRILQGDYGSRYVLTPINLDEQQQLGNDLNSELVKLSNNWQSDVIPDQSNFLLYELMKLANFENKNVSLEKGFFSALTDLITGDPLKALENLLKKSSVDDLFNYDKVVTVKGAENILNDSGLNKVNPSLDSNMEKYLSENITLETILKYLSEQGWTIASKKDCVPPYMNQMTLQYKKSAATISDTITNNNFTIKVNPPLPFYPFYKICGTPLFYLGFSGLPCEQFWTAYFSFSIPNPSKPTINTQNYDVLYEYYSNQGWESLPVDIDQTEGLIKSGIITWKLPDAATPLTLFALDKPLWWVRFTLVLRPLPKVDDSVEEAGDNKDKKSQAEAPIGIEMKGIYPNSVWAEGYTTEYNKVLGTSNKTANQQFQITPYLVYPEQKIEIRESTYPEPDQAKIIKLEEGADAIRIVDNGGVQEIWVCWHAVPNLRLSTPKSRHYTIDYETGTIQFGNGVQGMIPPGLKNNIVAAEFRRGNNNADMPSANQLTKLLKNIPNVKSVTNYEDAYGKQGQETIEQFLERIPKNIKTRDRAVTLEDFQLLALQSTNLVARASCYQNKTTPHYIEVIIVPSHQYGSYYPGAQLTENVLNYLQDRALPTLKQQIIIRAPDYQKIDVHATIVIQSGFTQTSVYSDLQAALSQFFDPVEGQYDSKGWDFASTIYTSQVNGVILNVPGVTGVYSLKVLPYLADSGTTSPVPENGPGPANDPQIDDDNSHGQTLNFIKLNSKTLPLPGNFDIQFEEPAAPPAQGGGNGD